MKYVLERVATIRLQKYGILLKSNQILSDYILNSLDFCSLSTELQRFYCNSSHCSGLCLLLGSLLKKTRTSKEIPSFTLD